MSALDPDEGYRVDAELVIETPFLLCDTTGTWHELGPGTGTNLAPPSTCSQEPSPPLRSKDAAHRSSPSTTTPYYTS